MMALVKEFNHLFKMYKFLLKKTENNYGHLIIRTALLNKCCKLSENLGKELPKWLFCNDTMCPNCFSFWANGNYRLYFGGDKKSKNKKTSKNADACFKKEMKMVLKCLVCHKSTSIKYDKSVSDGNSSKLRKNAGSENPRLYNNIDSNKLVGLKKIARLKGKQLCLIDKPKKKNNATCKTKSDLKTNKRRVAMNVNEIVGKRKRNKKSYLTTLNDLL